ncbi:hypothetical protein SAMN06265379_11340 [Saccharicrinis carchari]|uniref:Outer membrane protein beta-barrel domain-containing protein n=1 Tax=Saccharicrinis carchari TaxID=1168039 RepID=A0A521F215_SACCC|nr:hypothetical protein [Saccharicrinis carchari]SMO90147.1 hypothetical protein SAMN06265379_11340 [Saccharicrinis carchari]
MVKKVFVCIAICLACSSSGLAQLTYRLEIGVGGSPYIEHGIAKTVAGGIGYSFFEELTVFGGLNLFSQRSYVFSFEAESDLAKREENKTENFTSFLLQAGTHYSITLKSFTENKSQWEYKRIGVFPEINTYFNPHLNRKYKAANGQEYKAPSTTQLSYGFGGGVFYGSWKMYLALKYECNTIDNLESVRKLAPTLEKSNTFNHVVSLVFVFR